VFTGITDDMVRFFLSIRFNNNAAFFEANRGVYAQHVQQPLRALAEDLAPTLEGIDPRFDTRPGRVLSRIRRDTRFSKNKDPYRDHMWLGWRYAGQMREEATGFYFEVSPEGTHWGFGGYGEHKPLMDAIRRRLVNRPKELLFLFKAAGVPDRFTLNGTQYKRMPVPPEIPAALAPLYCNKGFYFENVARPDDGQALYSDAIVYRLRQDFAALAPLYHWVRDRQAELGL
jgi:uncharacterized protein (TIGR02453 family)